MPSTVATAVDTRWPDDDVWAEIDHAVLAENARVLRRAMPRSAELGILVKANACGRGLVMAASTAMAAGADRLIITANELATRAATIPNDILASIDPQLPRVHVDDGHIAARSRGVTHLVFPDLGIRFDNGQLAEHRS